MSDQNRRIEMTQENMVKRIVKKKYFVWAMVVIFVFCGIVSSNVILI